MWSRQPLDSIKSDLLEFSKALDRGDERSAQIYLESNPAVFSFIADDASGYIAPQFKLADKYIADFAVFSRDRWSNCPRLLSTFIEVEAPSMKLFTKAGNPTAHLTHAIRQVQDWKAWVTDNIGYFRDSLQPRFDAGDFVNIEYGRPVKAPYLSDALKIGMYHRYMVIGGRRATMDIPNLVRLAEMNNNFYDIKIITYDAILNGWMRISERSSRFVSWDGIE
jgi:hypothetical protein